MVPVKYPVILIAGGKGTRSIDPSVPKSLHLIASVSLIEHQIRFLQEIGCEDLIIVGNFGFDQICEHIENSDFKGIRIQLIAEEEFGGTLGALKFSQSYVGGKGAWVILGDLYFQVNLHEIEKFVKLDQTDLLVLSHPNDHPFDSDLVSFDQLTNEIFEFQSKGSSLSNGVLGNSAVAGIYYINFHKLDSAPNRGDISGDLIPFSLRHNWKTLNFTTVEYCKDSGTSERIKSIESDLNKGVEVKRSKIGKSACFIDLDNTLLSNIEIKNQYSEFQLDRDLLAHIRILNKSGIPVIILSNQPGISKGFFTIQDWGLFRMKVERELAKVGAFIDDWVICPHHPESGHLGELSHLKVPCACRKPLSGMFEEMSRKHNIDLTTSIMVGDSDVDSISSRKVGVTFLRSSVNPQLPQAIHTSEALEKVVSLFVDY